MIATMYAAIPRVQGAPGIAVEIPFSKNHGKDTLLLKIKYPTKAAIKKPINPLNK
jgi:hypothetical protein